MKKTLVKLLLLAASVVPLASCGEDDLYADKDFDGLYDLVDPTPDENISGFKHEDSTYGLSNEILVPVDYRNFVFDNEPVFNNDIAMMAAVISNYSYSVHSSEWSIITSKYENDESEINPVLVQFGFSNIEYVELSGFSKDQYDVCGLYLGNHVFNYENKLHQVICVSVDGYPVNSAWYSNFDVGADSDVYYEMDGDHPMWTHKENHKGFDVTINRVFPRVIEYADKVNNDLYDEQIFFVSGHSRGGALSQLIGKNLKDNNKKSVVYGFNGCNVTTESNISVLRSYNNIFNVVSVNDFVSCYPFDFMGFNKYGKIYTYDLFEENSYFKSIFNHDFDGNNQDELNYLNYLCKLIFGLSREEMYLFREPDENFPEYESATSYEDAEERLASMKAAIELGVLENYVKCEIIENDNIETLLDSPYKVQFYTRPIALLRLLGTVLRTAFDSALPIINIVSTLANCIKFLTRTLGIITKEGIPSLVVSKYATPHTQATCVAGAHVAKEKK